MITELFTLLSLPFVTRALIGSILIAILGSFIGILITLRRSSFYGDAIAHASLTGVALGLLLGINPILGATIYTIAVALVLPILKKRSKLPMDTLLGMILPVSLGLGVLVLSFLPGYQPELLTFLFGSILAITITDLLVVGILCLIILIIFAFYRQRLLLISFDEDYARVIGLKTNLYETIFNLMVAVTVVAGLKLVGIILVNALLIIPPSIARLYARSLKSMFILTPIISVSVVISGMLFSLLLDLPTGPTIAVTSGLAFILSLLFKNVKSNHAS